MTRKGPRESRTPRASVGDRRLTGADHAVLRALGCYTNADGRCRASLSRLARDTQYVRRTVIRAVHHLVELGYLAIDPQKEGRVRQAHAYRLLDPAEEQQLELNPSDRGGGDIGVTGVVTSPSPGVVTPDVTRVVTSDVTTTSLNGASNDSPHFVRGRARRSRANGKHPGQRELIPPRLAEPGDLPATSTERGSRLPADWQPSDIDRQFAARKGLSPPEVDRAAEHFRAHYHAQAGPNARRANWSAAWSKWVLNEVDRREERHGLGTADPADAHRGADARPVSRRERTRAALARFAGRAPPDPG